VTSSLSDATHPATLAPGPNNTIQYTARRAVSQLQNGCVPSGCTPKEFYFYNKRMQMAVAKLGNSTHGAVYSREYSYYEGSVPSSCSERATNWPTGSNNNGNVVGYYHLDNANGGALNHPYDSTSRQVGKNKNPVYRREELTERLREMRVKSRWEMGKHPAGPG